MQIPQNKRVTGKEQYYTPPEISLYCLDKILSFSQIEGQVWLEPAGGNGSFIQALLSKGVTPDKIVSYDIEPKHQLVSKTDDFLEETLNGISGCTTITNPPFGRANKLSVPFFNKCAEVSDFIGFIVPKSWRKWSVHNRLNPWFHLVHDEELSVNYNYENDEKRSKGKLATVFQIWERRNYKRAKITVKDRGYIKKVSPEEADVSLTIFGRGCGKVKLEFPRKPNTTQMFLKVADSSVLEALTKADYGRFCNNVAFVEALSMKEINFLLNEFFDNLI